LNDETRRRTYPGEFAPGGVDYCDGSYGCGGDGQSPDWHGEGWYRVEGAAGNKITDHAVLTIDGEDDKCGTTFAGYINGRVPTVPGENVEVEVCYDNAMDDVRCIREHNINMTMCDTYFVYYLKDTSSARYCTED